MLTCRLRYRLILARIYSKVPLQVHAVMQQAEHINDVVRFDFVDAEQDEMTALAPVSRNMKRPDIVVDFRPLLGPYGGWAGA